MSGDGGLFSEVRQAFEPYDLDVDQAFDVVSDETRRRVLFELEEVGGSVGLATLANRIAGSRTVDEGPNPVQRIYLSLYHHHVPKLVDFGLISYDDNEGTIRITSTGSEFVAVFRRNELGLLS